MYQSQKDHHSVLRRLKYAWSGLTYFFFEEIDYRILLAVIFTMTGIVYLIQPTKIEYMIIALAVGMGVFMGIGNMIVEELCDLYSKEYHPKIKIIKDLASGACLFFILICLILLVLIAT